MKQSTIYCYLQNSQGSTALSVPKWKRLRSQKRPRPAFSGGGERRKARFFNNPESFRLCKFPAMKTTLSLACTVTHTWPALGWFVGWIEYICSSRGNFQQCWGRPLAEPWCTFTLGARQGAIQGWVERHLVMRWGGVHQLCERLMIILAAQL